MISFLRKAGLLRLLVLLLLFVAVTQGLGRRFTSTEVPHLYDAALEERQPTRAPSGSVSLHLSGMALFRVNALYVNGKRVPILYAENINYSECRISVDPAVFTVGKPYKIRVGKSYPFSLGVIYKSNSISFTPMTP